MLNKRPSDLTKTFKNEKELSARKNIIQQNNYFTR